MLAEAEIEITTKVRLDIDLVAKWFANLNDDEKARFFVAVAEAAKQWPPGPGNHGPGHQWFLIGSHLRNCECSSIDAQDMIHAIHCGLEHGMHA